MFAAFRFLTACCIAMVWVQMHTLSMEYVDRHHTNLYVAGKDLGGPCSRLLTMTVAFFLRDWMQIHFVVAAIMGVCALTIFLYPESPRWLAANGRTIEAMKESK